MKSATLALVFALTLGTTSAVQAQIGAGNLSLSIDGAYVLNGESNETGSYTVAGTALTGNVAVNGVSNNGGTTTVTCYDSTAGTTIFSWSTTVSGGKSFTWTPETMETHDLYCSGTWSGEHVNGTATTPTASIPVTGPTSILAPDYKVTSIIYSSPGDKSSNGFTNSTTDGTTSSVGSNFTAGTTSTYTSGGDFLGLGGTLSISFGMSASIGSSTTMTETFTDGAGVSLANSSSNPNAINHLQDLILVWLNPEISITPTGSTSLIYSVGTPITDGEPEEVDQVEVTATDMVGTNGVSTVPAAVLNLQDDASGNPTLPGLASICANLNVNEYESLSCTLANQCGCKPSDFTGILAADPLLNFSSTTSPLTADTSGVTACSNPAPADECRYVPVPSTPGGSEQQVQLLAGPECDGCDTPVNSFTQSDSNVTTHTLSQSFTQTLGFSWKVDLLDETGGPSYTHGTQFSWTESESSGASNGTANGQAVSLSSATVGCYEDVPVFEDTVFHTFVFQQPANNTSCP